MERSSKVSLDVLSIKEPCTEDWDEMEGDARVRHCALCDRNVFNLSEMTRDEAERVVSGAEGRVCVRFYKRADGTVTTTDCAPDRLAAARRKAKRALKWSAAMVGGLLAAAGGAGYAALYGYHEVLVDHPDDEGCDVMMMGEAPEDLSPVAPPVDQAPPEDPTSVEPTIDPETEAQGS